MHYVIMLCASVKISSLGMLVLGIVNRRDNDYTMILYHARLPLKR